MKILDIFGLEVTVALPSGKRYIAGCYNSTNREILLSFVTRFKAIPIRECFNSETIDGPVKMCLQSIARHGGGLSAMVEALLQTPSDDLLDRWPPDYSRNIDLVALERYLLTSV